MLREETGEYDSFRRRFGDPTVELHAAYDAWLADMSGREGNVLAPFEFDLERYPEQGIYVPKVEASDPHPMLPDWMYYSGINWMMSRAVGSEDYKKLLGQLRTRQASPDDPRMLPQRLVDNQLECRNTMVVTSHFSFFELGLFKAMRVQEKRDRRNIKMGGILINKLMSRQSYHGKKVVDLLGQGANLYFSYPKSASAEKFGVPRSAMMLGNALLQKVLKPDLASGGLELDAALTGKQIVPIYRDNGDLDHYEIPEVDPSSAKIIEGFHDIVPATIIKSPVTDRWEMVVGDVVDVQEMLKTNTSAEVVDLVYHGIVGSVERLTGKEVNYSPITGRLGHPSAADMFAPK